MKFTLLGFALIVVWFLSTFVGNVENGWVHVPLAVGAVLIAIGIVVGGEEGEERGKDEG
jgi:hypothetical protein